MTTLREGQLTFNFPAAWVVERFDVPGKVLPKHTAPVDFVIETADRMYFIEVKDPSNTNAPPREHQAFARKMETAELTYQELVPKARTSWSHLHLMGRTGKPITYVVAIGTERLSLQPALLLILTDRLRGRLEHEADLPWVRKYVAGCIVVPALDLGSYLQGVTVARDSGAS